MVEIKELVDLVGGGILGLIAGNLVSVPETYFGFKVEEATDRGEIVLGTFAVADSIAAYKLIQNGLKTEGFKQGVELGSGIGLGISALMQAYYTHLLSQGFWGEENVSLLPAGI